MTIASSSLTVASGPLFNATELRKLQGTMIETDDAASLKVLVDATPMWPTNTLVRVRSEPVGTFRLFNGTNALQVVLPNRERYTLAADTNTVIEFSAAPTGGNNNDLGYNPSTRVSFTKTSGTWVRNDEVAVTASRALLASDLNKTLVINSSSAVVLDNSGGVGYPGAWLKVRRAGSGTVAFTTGSGLVEGATGAAAAGALLQGAITLLTCDAAGVLVLQG